MWLNRLRQMFLNFCPPLLWASFCSEWAVFRHPFRDYPKWCLPIRALCAVLMVVALLGTLPMPVMALLFPFALGFSIFFGSFASALGEYGRALVSLGVSTLV